MEAAGWEVSWPGKSTFLPARETDDEDDDVDEAGPRRRVYFLLPPEASVPAQVTITPPGRTPILVKPLPAIFPSGFNLETGPLGVLHTLWAKKRLSELEREMEAEMRANTESVGLEMAMAEKDWIVANFLEAKPPPVPCDGQPCDGASVVPVPLRSPGPGRLADKLKGMRLGTSAADLVPSSTGNAWFRSCLKLRRDEPRVTSHDSSSHEPRFVVLRTTHPVMYENESLTPWALSLQKRPHLSFKSNLLILIPAP